MLYVGSGGGGTEREIGALFMPNYILPDRDVVVDLPREQIVIYREANSASAARDVFTANSLLLVRSFVMVRLRNWIRVVLLRTYRCR